MNPIDKTSCKNIFSEIPPRLQNEVFETILKKDNISITRIVSNGHTTHEGDWYDQTDDEWVILLQGQATVLYEKDERLIKLMPGDYLFIPSHTRHRVDWTLPDNNTIWLAVHL